MANSEQKVSKTRETLKTIIIFILLFLLTGLGVGFYSIWKKYEAAKISLSAKTTASIYPQEQISFYKKEILPFEKNPFSISKYKLKISKYKPKKVDMKEDKTSRHTKILFPKQAFAHLGLKEYLFNSTVETVLAQARKDCSPIDKITSRIQPQTGFTNGISYITCHNFKFHEHRHTVIFHFDLKRLLESISIVVDVPSIKTSSSTKIEKEFETEMKLGFNFLSDIFKNFYLLTPTLKKTFSNITSFLSFYRSLNDANKTQSVVFHTKADYSNIHFQLDIEKRTHSLPYSYKVTYYLSDRSIDHVYPEQYKTKDTLKNDKPKSKK